MRERGSWESSPTERCDCPSRQGLDPGLRPEPPEKSPLSTFLSHYSPSTFSVWPRLGTMGTGEERPVHL